MRALILALMVMASPQVSAQSRAAGQTLVRAAGMPLQVNDLPAGTLTVRVVRGAFNENLAGRDVKLESGHGKGLSARTDQQGRATFSVTPGTEVRAIVIVDGESLESEVFAMPPAGGVRLLLVADGAIDGALPPPLSTSAVTDLPPGHPPIDIPGTAVAPADAGNDAKILIACSLVATTLIGALLNVTLWRRRRRLVDSIGMATPAAPTTSGPQA